MWNRSGRGFSHSVWGFCTKEQTLLIGLTRAGGCPGVCQGCQPLPGERSREAAGSYPETPGGRAAGCAVPAEWEMSGACA